MVRNIIRCAALILPLSALSGTVGAKDNVEIRLSGHFYAEPATVQMIVAIEPNAENRTLRVEADGATCSARPRVALAGDKGTASPHHSVQEPRGRRVPRFVRR